MAKKKAYGEEKPKSEKVEKIEKTSTGKNNYVGLLIGGLIIGLLIGVILTSTYYTRGQSSAEKVLSPEEAGQKAVNWISRYFEGRGQNVSVKLVNATDTGEGVYHFVVELSGDNGKVNLGYYVTKDGELFFPQAIPTGKFIESGNQDNNQDNGKPDEGIPKREKPEVRLFVMSYCPFGLQAEKAFLPVYKLLKDKADMTINFVYYAMHGKRELDENLRQYCIQSEQNDKYYDYLTCFTKTGNYTNCIDKAKISKSDLKSCMNRVDKEYNITKMYEDQGTWLSGRFPRFNVDLDLNKKYGVGGSPTFVINDKVVSLNRSPEAIKEAICSSFTNPPEECNQKLSETPTSPGFGGGVGTDSGGSCN